jgi:PhnB protein
LAILLILVSDGGGAREARQGHQPALEAGALTIEKPVDTPYGDRRATVQDPWGNIWQIATHVAHSLVK